MMDTIEGFTVEPERCFGVGDRVVAVLRSGGRGKASGVEIHRQIAQIFTVRDGRIASVVGYDDPEAALAAVEKPEPSPNVDVVRRQFEAIGRGGIEAAADFWHPDIDWRAVEGAVDDVGPIQGRDAMLRYYKDWVDIVEDIRAGIDRVVYDSGDTLVAVLYTSGKGRGSSVSVTGHYTVVYTIRDGLIVRGREYETPEQAMAALEARD